MLKLEISYRVIISCSILVSFREFFEDYIFCIVKYLSFYNSSFALRYLLVNANGKATNVTHPLFLNCMHLVVENGNAFLSINGCQTALIMAKAKTIQVLQKQKRQILCDQVGDFLLNIAYHPLFLSQSS